MQGEIDRQKGNSERLRDKEINIQKQIQRERERERDRDRESNTKEVATNRQKYTQTLID